MSKEQYSVSQEGVYAELRSRGYNFLISRAYAVQLTKPDPTKRFKISGASYQNALGGVSHVVFDQIMRWSLDDKEAADQIEKISTGVIQLPEVGPRQQQTPNVSEQAIERMAANRADAMIASRLKEIELLRLKMEQQIHDLQNPPVAPVQEKKKPGRPKGSKNKPKLDKDGLPELTEEQQAMMDRIKFAPAE